MSQMNDIHSRLLEILSIAVSGEHAQAVLSLQEMAEVQRLAHAHTVDGLLADMVLRGQAEVKCRSDERNRKRSLVMELVSIEQQHRAIKSNFDVALSELTLLLNEGEIDFVVFKGPAVASLYASPWSRTMGDIDFYVPEWNYERALSLIQQKLKLTVERCDTDKHDSFSYRGIRFEMHYQMETFGAGKHQRYFSALVDKEIKDGRLGHFCVSTGVQVPMLSPEADLILVFKHMFNHLIGEGVGLRQVTDVAVLIHAYAPTLNISALREHLQNIGYLKAFDAMVALVGKYYNVSWDAYRDYLSSKDFRMADLLMADIMKNGNFGRMDYKHRSGWKKRMETTCRFFANCMKYFCLAPWEIMCLVPKRICISLRAH